MDPLQWMGAVRMRVQTADKNPHHSSTSVNILWIQKLRVCKKLKQISPDEALLWIMDLYFSQKKQFEVKKP